MTSSERVAPKGAPRGNAAGSEVVEVYKIVAKAEGPLTVPQIAEQMPKIGYLSAAMNAYREHKEANDPSWLEGRGDRWGPVAQREAMTWWVRRIVQHARNIKILNVASITKISHNRITEEGRYRPGRAPKVRVMQWVESPTLVEWTPDLAEKQSRGHVAGMEFIKRYDEYLAGKRLKADADELLKLADRAIRARQSHGA